MNLSNRPRLNDDAIAILAECSKHCHSQSLNGLLIEVASQFLATRGQVISDPHPTATPPFPQVAIDLASLDLQIDD